VSVLNRANVQARRDIAATLAILLGFGGAATLALCRGRPAENARARCESILDRYVELRQRAAEPSILEHVVVSRREEARARAHEKGALARCMRSLSEDSAACAERAPTADELERCFP
jgi:hypothetical protein